MLKIIKIFKIYQTERPTHWIVAVTNVVSKVYRPSRFDRMGLFMSWVLGPHGLQRCVVQANNYINRTSRHCDWKTMNSIYPNRSCDSCWFIFSFLIGRVLYVLLFPTSLYAPWFYAISTTEFRLFFSLPNKSIATRPLVHLSIVSVLCFALFYHLLTTIKRPFRCLVHCCFRSIQPKHHAVLSSWRQKSDLWTILGTCPYLRQYLHFLTKLKRSAPVSRGRVGKQCLS